MFALFSSFGKALLVIQVYLVTGGYDGQLLDSTEVYDPSVGSWVTCGVKLPRPTSDLRAINIDDRVLIFGRLICIAKTLFESVEYSQKLN